MVSAGISWYGATRPFFVGEKGMKVNSKVYHQHLKKELFPAANLPVNRNDWIFAQDGASSHTSNPVQGFLKDTLKRPFIAKDAWPPSSPDTNLLDYWFYWFYWFWDGVKLKVYDSIVSRNEKTR
jgi:hypothetical protein